MHSFTLGLIVVSILIFLPNGSSAGVQTASSCSYSDVLSAYNAALAGDTVSIPAGNCTWSSTLTVSKQLTLTGAGSASTIINWGGSTVNNALINLAPSNDIPIRVTGIGFKMGSSVINYRVAVFIQGKTDGSFPLTKIRVDHLAIQDGIYTIWAKGWVYGVIDNNSFLNVSSGIFAGGDDNFVWSRPYTAGTANALFIEDNTFTLNNSVGSTNQDAQVYIQQGANVVVRYNTFDATAFTTANFLNLMLDNHGNDHYGAPLRGSPIFEAYNNTARAYMCNVFIGQRGGSQIIHDNTMTTVVPGANPIVFTEEEAWQTILFSPLRTAWPAQDQITNSFIWNNTYNGSPVTDILLGTPALDAVFIQRNRDYFMHAPQASGGKSTYSGRAGGSTSAPTTSDTGTLSFSSSGANAYYPYAPYTYPHPLREGIAPPSPSNLTISSQ